MLRCVRRAVEGYVSQAAQGDKPWLRMSSKACLSVHLQARAKNCLGLVLDANMATLLWLSWVRSLPPRLVQTTGTGGSITRSVNHNE